MKKSFITLGPESVHYADVQRHLFACVTAHMLIFLYWHSKLFLCPGID